MQQHWRTLQWLTIVLVAAFVAALMNHKYALGYASLASAFIVVLAYLIAVGRFKGRPDPENEKRGRAAR